MTFDFTVIIDFSLYITFLCLVHHSVGVCSSRPWIKYAVHHRSLYKKQFCDTICTRLMNIQSPRRSAKNFSASIHIYRVLLIVRCALELYLFFSCPSHLTLVILFYGIVYIPCPYGFAVTPHISRQRCWCQVHLCLCSECGNIPHTDLLSLYIGTISPDAIVPSVLCWISLLPTTATTT